MKKILLSLFVSFLGLILLSSFCSAGSISNYCVIPSGTYSSTVQVLCWIPIPSVSSFYGDLNFSCNYDFDGTYITSNNAYIVSSVLYNNNWRLGNYNTVSLRYDDFFNSSSFSGVSSSSISNNQKLGLQIQYQGGGSFTLNSPMTISCVFSGSQVIGCPTCPSQYTSEECQTEYDLIPSSDLSTCNNNLQSCQIALSGWDNTLNNCSNNLLSCESSLSSCIQSNCPIDTGSVMWSSIWINGIQHLGKPVINIDIPSNIYWDYSTNDEQFDLYIGSGYDQEYIDGVIAVNSYRPSSEDFTSIFVGGLTLVFPYIVIALFIIFIRKLIKRIFK